MRAAASKARGSKTPDPRLPIDLTLRGRREGGSGAGGGNWSPEARTILAGGVAVYLIAISFIHWVNQNSLRDRFFLARLGTAAILAGLVVLGSTLAPLAFTGLLALAMLSLTTFETLSASRVEPG